MKFLPAITVLATIASASATSLRHLGGKGLKISSSYNLRAANDDGARRLKGKQICTPSEDCLAGFSSPSCPDTGCNTKFPYCCGNVCEKFLTFCDPDATNHECFTANDIEQGGKNKDTAKRFSLGVYQCLG